MAAVASMAKAVCLLMISSLLLLEIHVAPVGAVDFLTYSETECQGTVKACFNIEAGKCCQIITGAPSISIENLLQGQSANVYEGGNCAVSNGSAQGPTSNKCFYGGVITGVMWNNNALVEGNGTLMTAPTGTVKAV